MVEACARAAGAVAIAAHQSGCRSEPVSCAPGGEFRRPGGSCGFSVTGARSPTEMGPACNTSLQMARTSPTQQRQAPTVNAGLRVRVVIPPPQAAQKASARRVRRGGFEALKPRTRAGGWATSNWGATCKTSAKKTQEAATASHGHQREGSHCVLFAAHRDFFALSERVLAIRSWVLQDVARS